MPGAAPSYLGEIDGEFNFGKERRRDPFYGRSVRMRGALQRTWFVNDLRSQNPELTATDRVVRSMHSSNYNASCTPVTAVDFCNRTLETLAFGIERWGRMEGGTLGKRNAWDDVEEALHEHAVQAQSDKYNKCRRTRDVLFKVPVIGHVISTNEDEVQPHNSWPILNGKA